MSNQLTVKTPPEQTGGECVLSIPYEENFALLWKDGLSGVPLSYDDNGVSHVLESGLSNGSGYVFHLYDSFGLPDEGTISDAVWYTNPVEYLRALNWAAIWRLRFPESGMRVIVQRPTNDHSLFRRLIEPLLDRIESDEFRPGVIPGILLVTDASQSSLISSWIEKPHVAPREDHASFPALRALLQASINTDPEGHHSLSNIAGAHLLRDAVPEVSGIAARHPVEMAMCRLVFAIAESLTRDSQREIRGGSWWNCASDVPYVLIDDMAELWRPFLAGALGRADVADVHAPAVGNGSDGAALANLEAKMRRWAQEPYERRFMSLGDVFPEVEPTHSGRTDFILFLDLRLFPGETEEAAFVAKLRDIAELMKTSYATAAQRPPWPSIETSQMDLRGLNLLPRLLSLFDPTLPIVLFSSTDRKSIVEHLNDYPNIVTDFQKPVFRNALGDASDYLDQCRCRFASAMKRAEGILKTRVILEKLSHL